MSAEPIHLTPHLIPVAPIARVLSRFDRAQIEAFAEVAIALLDLQDGDPDAEVTDAEDDFATIDGSGPGCQLTDPAEEDDPAGQCDEDGINTDFGRASVHSGPGCPIGDGAEVLP